MSWERELTKLASEFDRKVVRGKKHYKLIKEGHQPVFAGSTPSDHRALKNIRRELRNYSNPERTRNG